MAVPSSDISTRRFISLEELSSNLESISFADGKGHSVRLTEKIREIQFSDGQQAGRGVTIYQSNGRNTVFSLDEIFPQFIFKVRLPCYSPTSPVMFKKLSRELCRVSLSDSDLFSREEAEDTNVKDGGQTKTKLSKGEEKGTEPDSLETQLRDEAGAEPTKLFTRFSVELREGLRGGGSRSSPNLPLRERRGSYASHSRSMKTLEDEFANSAAAKKICEVKRLSRVVIPDLVFRRIIINNDLFDVVIKEKIPEAPSTRITCEDETIIELARFILLLGYSDVNPRNVIPIEGGKKVAVVDFGSESMKGAMIGLFGFAFSNQKGLCDFIPDEQKRIVVALAKSVKLEEREFFFSKAREAYRMYG